MNDNVTFENYHFILGCGDRVEVLSQLSNPISKRVKIAPSREFVMRVEGTERVLFQTFDEELFSILHENLMEVFQKLFATVSPMKCNMLVKGDSSAFNKDEIIDEIKNVGFTTFEGVFLSFLMDKSNCVGADFATQDRKEIVDSIVEYFNSETFDTVDKINKVIQPWYTILGVENVKFMSSVDVPFESVKKFQSDPELLEIFKKYWSIKSNRFDNEKKKLLADVEFNTHDYNYFREFSGTRHDMFFELPINNRKFRKSFMKLNVFEAQILFQALPRGLSDDVFVEWMNHETVRIYRDVDEKMEAEKEETADEAKAEDLLCREIIPYFSMKDSFSISYAVKFRRLVRGAGYRSVATEYFPHKMERFSSFDEFEEVHIELDSAWVNNWNAEPHTTDFVLLKLFEMLGAEKTVEAILNVVKSDEKLTAAQWLTYPANHEMLKDAPVSWWSSLLGECEV